jgi:hypothetical protein
MSYIAPLKDMLFNIKHLANIDQIAQLPGMEDAGFRHRAGGVGGGRQVQ